jgi:iron complex outermembrane receptor protein
MGIFPAARARRAACAGELTDFRGDCMSRVLWFGGVAACVFISTAGAAVAQDTQIEEVVVTARKIEENAQDIPVAVTAMTGAGLERQNVREVRDLKSLAPSLVFGQGGSSPGAVNPSLRGQTQPDNNLATDAAVALYVDNVVLPRSYGLRANMVDVSRIEVLRGPQGTLYGKNTTGGLINVITNDPTGQWGGSVRVNAGNYGAWDVTAIVNIPLGDDMGLRLVAERGQHDAFGHDGAGRGLAYGDNSYLRAKFKGEWGRFSLRASADYSSTGLSGIYRLAGLTPATATAPEGGTLTREAALELFGASNPTTWAQALPVVRSYVGGDFYKTNGRFQAREDDYARDVSLDMAYELTDDIKVRSITGYRSLAFGYPSDLDGTPFTGTHPRRAAQDDFISQELQVLGGDAHLNWVFGGYGSWEHGKEYSTTATAPLALSPTRLTQLNLTNGKLTAQSYAVFGQANWEFVPNWTLTVGGRYTSDKRGLTTYNQTFFNGATFSCSVPVALRPDPAFCQGVRSDTFKEPTWTASLTYKPTDDITTYAKASHGFRSGGEQYRGSTSLESFQPFQPETVNEYELGLKTQFFDRSVRINLAAFYDEITDVQRSVIIAVPSTGATATVQTNAASATVKGVELEGTWRVTPQLTINGAGSVIDPKYDEFRDFTGDRSGEDWPTPKVQYSFDVTYVQPTGLGDLTGTLSWAYQSKQNLAPAAKQKAQVTQKAYGLLNARLGLNVDSQDFTVALFARNLTVKKYLVGAVSLESIGWNTVVSGEPRVYGIEFTKRFGD